MFLPASEFCLSGLSLICLGCFAITTIISLGGDQYRQPEHDRQLETYFRVLYLSVNIGSFAGITLTGFLRATPCLGKTTCYPLAFGVLALFNLAAFCSLVAGRRWYMVKRPEGNVYTEVVKSIGVRGKETKKNLKLPYCCEHTSLISVNIWQTFHGIKKTGIICSFVPNWTAVVVRLPPVRAEEEAQRRQVLRVPLDGPRDPGVRGQVRVGREGLPQRPRPLLAAAHLLGPVDAAHLQVAVPGKQVGVEGCWSRCNYSKGVAQPRTKIPRA